MIKHSTQGLKWKWSEIWVNGKCMQVKMSQNGGKKKHNHLLNWAAKTENQQATPQESHLNQPISPETAHFTDRFKFFWKPHREASHWECDYSQISLQKHTFRWEIGRFFLPKHSLRDPEDLLPNNEPSTVFRLKVARLTPRLACRLRWLCLCLQPANEPSRASWKSCRVCLSEGLCWDVLQPDGKRDLRGIKRVDEFIAEKVRTLTLFKSLMKK